MPSHHLRRPLDLDTIIALERLRSRRASRLADQVRPLAEGLLCRRARGTWANVGIGLGLARDVSPQEVHDLVEFFSAIGKDARVEVGDRTRSSLVAALADAGFTLRAMVSVLAMTLESEPATPPNPPDIVIKRLDPTDVARCRATARVLAASFAPEGQEPSPEDVDANVQGLTHPDSTGFVAMAGDKPAGAGMMDVDPDLGLATLWGAAVAPEFRRRGVQAALMEHRLVHAWSFGARLITVETTAGGPTHRNAARRGFELVYGRAILVRAASNTRK